MKLNTKYMIHETMKVHNPSIDLQKIDQNIIYDIICV